MKVILLSLALLICSCQALGPLLTSPAAIEAETLLIEEAQHELTPQVRAPTVEKVVRC